MIEAYTVVCPCGWEREYTSRESFNDDPQRSAEQGAKGHAAACSRAYSAIEIAKSEHNGLRPDGGVIEPDPVECHECGRELDRKMGSKHAFVTLRFHDPTQETGGTFFACIEHVEDVAAAIREQSALEESHELVTDGGLDLVGEDVLCTYCGARSRAGFQPSRSAACPDAPPRSGGHEWIATEDLSFEDDLTLKPHPRELSQAINGDHVVRFTQTGWDPTVEFQVTGEPIGELWPAEIMDGEPNWTYVTIPADRIKSLVIEDGPYEVEKNGAALTVTASLAESRVRADGGRTEPPYEYCILCGDALETNIEFDTGVCGPCTAVGGEGYNALVVAPTSNKAHAAKVDILEDTVEEVQCGQTVPPESAWSALSRSELEDYADHYTPCSKCNLRKVSGVFAGITTLELSEPRAYPVTDMTVVTDGGTAIDDPEKPDCRYCGEPVDHEEPGHYKTPGDKFAHAECVAEDCYGDRERVATDRGVFRIQRVTITKEVGTKEEVLDSYWQAECPVCYRTHETEEASEDVRNDLVERVLDCCGAEWLPPEDYLEECPVCGHDHREIHECQPPAMREPVPDVDQDYECTDCDWDGHGTDLKAPMGECPECDSPAVQPAEPEVATDGGTTITKPDREPDPEGVREAATLIRQEHGLDAAIEYVQERFANHDDQEKCLVILGELRQLRDDRDRGHSTGGNA